MPNDKARPTPPLLRSRSRRAQADGNRQLHRARAGRRIHIELINWPFLQEHRGTPAEYKAGLDLAIERGWLRRHESGTYLKFTDSGAALFA